MGPAARTRKNSREVYFPDLPGIRIDVSFAANARSIGRRASRPAKERAMAKGQKKSNREIRKPKADKGPKKNASQPSLKPGGIKGLENMKNG
jgi:hypothetical protein